MATPTQAATDVGADNTQAATTATTQPNIPVVTEVKASQTLTVVSVPADTETITIGSCVVTFEAGAGVGADNSATPVNELNCAGGATINTVTLANPGVALTPTDIANALDNLTNVSDGVHGALTLTADTATTTKFTTT